MLQAPTQKVEQSAKDAANQRKVELALDVVRRPKLNDKQRTTVLAGLLASIESNALIEISKEFLSILPSYKKFDHTQKEIFNQSFLAAILAKRLEVLELFLSKKYKPRVLADEIVKGLNVSLNVEDDAVAARMVQAVAEFPADDLKGGMRYTALSETLKKLISQDRLPWVKSILEKHPSLLKDNLDQFAKFCAQNRLFSALSYFISKDPTFSSISLSSVLENLLAFLEQADEKAQILVEQTLLKMLVKQAASKINSLMRSRVLAYLLKIDTLEHVKILFAAHQESFNQEELDQLLSYGIAKEDNALVHANVQLRRKGHLALFCKWTPSLDSLKAVIDKNNVGLLKSLLACDRSDGFTLVVNQALVYAASLGKKGVVQELVVTLVTENVKKCPVEAALAAAQNGHFEVVKYLFANLPGITMRDKRSVLEKAHESIKPQNEALIRQELAQEEGAALLKGTMGLVKAALKEGDPLTNGNIYVRLKEVVARLEQRHREEILVQLPPEQHQPTVFDLSGLSSQLDSLDLQEAAPAVVEEDNKKRGSGGTSPRAF